MNALSATPNLHIKAELRQNKIPRVSRIHSTISHPLYHPTLRIMSQHTVTITGVPGIWEGSGLQGSQPPPRREISDLIKDEKQFSLYVQALRKTAPVTLHLISHAHIPQSRCFRPHRPTRCHISSLVVSMVFRTTSNGTEVGPRLSTGMEAIVLTETLYSQRSTESMFLLTRYAESAFIHILNQL